MDFRKELSELLNKHSKENGSDTPDYALTQFVEKSIEAFDHGVNLRSEFYNCGHSLKSETTKI